MTSRSPQLVKVLNAALGLELADFDEARAFINSPAGSETLDAWLASHPDDDGDTNDSVTEFTNGGIA